MINISITKKNGYVTNVSISGHANTAKYGSDIVCASVSVLSQSIINAMIKALDYRDDFFFLDDSGKIKIDIPDDITQIQSIKMQTLADVLDINFQDLSKTYGKYIKLEVKEVGKDDKN
jgi:hypothetical protein